MGLLDRLATQLEPQIPAQLQAAIQQTLDDFSPSATSAVWPCIATIATPALLSPATAKFASKSPCSAVVSVAVWPAA